MDHSAYLNIPKIKHKSMKAMNAFNKIDKIENQIRFNTSALILDNLMNAHFKKNRNASKF